MLKLSQTQDIMKYKETLMEIYIESIQIIFAVLSSAYYKDFLTKIRDYALNYNASDTMFDFYKQLEHRINYTSSDKIS